MSINGTDLIYSHIDNNNHEYKLRQVFLENNLLNFRNQLKLHYKTSFIYLYKKIRQTFIEILENVFPKSICRLIVSFNIIDKHDYLPSRIPQNHLPIYSSSFDLILLQPKHYLKASFNISKPLKLSKGLHIQTELYLTTCCQPSLEKLIILLVKYSERHQIGHPNKHQGIRSHLILDELDQYQKKIPHQFTNCKCQCNRDNSTRKMGTQSDYLHWNSYRYRDQSSFYHLIYNDIIRLFLYINYRLDY